MLQRKFLLSSLPVQVGGTALHMGLSCLVCQCKLPQSILTALMAVLQPPSFLSALAHKDHAKP